MLLLSGLAGLAVYDGVTGPYPLASLEPLVRRIFPSRGQSPRPGIVTKRPPAGDPAEARGGGGVKPHRHPEDDQIRERHDLETEPRGEPGRDRPHPGADVVRGAHAQDLTQYVTVDVYQSKDCTGEPLAFTAHRTEHKCTRCFDACRANFPDGKAALNNIKSYKVVYSGPGEMPVEWTVSSFNVCGGTFAYSASAMRKATIGSGVRPENGCIATDGEYPNMIRFDGMPDPDDVRARPPRLSLTLYLYPFASSRPIPLTLAASIPAHPVLDLDPAVALHVSPCPAVAWVHSVWCDCARLVNPRPLCGAWLAATWPRLTRRPSQIYDAQSYHVVYSCESSTYFAYQAYANYYGFLHSNQQTDPKPGYTRLLTSTEEDDLSVANGGKIPTFTSKREPFSRRYSPYNKPTALTAFMEGPASPTEEVIVVIDPDNWLVQNIGPIAAKVKEGQAVATAAFYDGNPLVTDLYQKHICKKACDFIPDTVAVPYFVHREDAKKIAPLWKELTKQVFELFQDPKHAATYQSLQPGWCAEMYGYVFAAAELRIKHTILPNLQHRDVDGKISWDEAMSRRIRMIHMGRAWFKAEWAKEHAARWIHRPAWEYSPQGMEQVWCKCNATAADERPWPLPPDVDFTSNVTLTLLHHSLLEYGNAPHNKYRVGYSMTYE